MRTWKVIGAILFVFVCWAPTAYTQWAVIRTNQLIVDPFGQSNFPNVIGAIQGCMPKTTVYASVGGDACCWIIVTKDPTEEWGQVNQCFITAPDASDRYSLWECLNQGEGPCPVKLNPQGGPVQLGDGNSDIRVGNTSGADCNGVSLITVVVKKGLVTHC